MRARHLVLASLALVFVCATAGAVLAASPPAAAKAAAPAQAAAPAETAEPTVVAYYFHGNQRCKTCMSIESNAERVLRERFADELAAGRLAWRTANIDKPENEHFVKDFQLVSSSVVLVELAGSRPVRHKVLDKVWQYARDQKAFETYVRDEMAAFLKADRG